MSRCKACNRIATITSEKYKDLCPKCYSAGEAKYSFISDYEFYDIRGSGYTIPDSIQHHLGKGSTLSN